MSCFFKYILICEIWPVDRAAKIRWVLKTVEINFLLSFKGSCKTLFNYVSGSLVAINYKNKLIKLSWN